MKSKVIQKTRQFSSLITHAFLGWCWSGALTGLGQLLISLETLLIIHTFLGPLGIGLLAWRFHQNFPGIQPLNTACWFTGIIIFLNVVLTAPFFENSFSIFSSIIGTWLPFILIFGAVYLAGYLSIRKAHS